MNSEELEQSLRAEFENYLKDVVAELRQSVSDFQDKINTDFEKHKEQLDQTLGDLSESIGKDRELEISFTETVAEHLKLARDEGASVTAAAIAEAEKMEESNAEDFSDLRNAIHEISEKDSQSEILKTLVNHAAAFTPRGAFFIVKNEHLVGWRVFGKEDHDDPKVVREVFFPVSTNTALSDAVDSLSTVSETGAGSEDDVMYRNKLGFVGSGQMYAIPLIARGRGVAVLYADSGTAGDSVNIAALEALMRVAGLTVEVLAAAPPVSRQKDDVVEDDTEDQVESHDVAPVAAEEVIEEEVHAAEPEQEVAEETIEEPFVNEYPGDEIEAVTEAPEADSYDFQPISESSDTFEPIESDFESSEAAFDSEDTEPAGENYDQIQNLEDSDDDSPVAFAESSWDAPEAVPSSDFNDTFESETPVAYDFEVEQDAPEVASSSDFNDSFESETPVASDYEAEQDAPVAFESFDSGINEPYVEPGTSEEPVSDYAFEANDDSPSLEEVESSADSLSFEAETPVADFSFSKDDDSSYEFDQTIDNDGIAAPEPAAAAETAPQVETAPPVRSRFADRNLDLPIEVSEDERRLHNDARRFARLLVSEIKLYNEQKVKEGRESSDLYERLREAIDRSREMYDKRVQPPVAAKFDYFNYELVNTLAEGDEIKLGASYPGAVV